MTGSDRSNSGKLRFRLSFWYVAAGGGMNRIGDNLNGWPQWLIAIALGLALYLMADRITRRPVSWLQLVGPTGNRAAVLLPAEQSDLIRDGLR